MTEKLDSLGHNCPPNLKFSAVLKQTDSYINSYGKYFVQNLVNYKIVLNNFYRRSNSNCVIAQNTL
jgi:hypothetical protein